MSDKTFAIGQPCWCIQRSGPWPVVTAGIVAPPSTTTGDLEHFMRVQFGTTGPRHAKTVAISNTFHTEEDAILALQAQLRQEVMLWDDRLADIRSDKKEANK